MDILYLLYKYLKNLYIGINEVKKKFVELCTDRKNIICEFFNQLFNVLYEVYPIEEEQFINFTTSDKIKKK